jgi:hypothetical protein
MIPFRSLLMMASSEEATMSELGHKAKSRLSETGSALHATMDINQTSPQVGDVPATEFASSKGEWEFPKRLSFQVAPLWKRI